MADFLKDKSIKYFGRDFEGFKRNLIEYTQAHHSGVINDYNESSPGMMLLELAAYVGDNLSYYIDQSFNELKRDTAKQKANVASFAKSLGYKPRGSRAATCKEHFIIEVPATTDGNGNTVPDDIYSPILLKGAGVAGPNGTTFETLDDVQFSASLGRDVTGSQFDSTTGLPTFFVLRKSVDIIAGQTKTATFSIGAFESFRTLELADTDVIEIISVSDSDGNEWTEVDYLTRNVVFDNDVNSNSDNDVVPYVLKMKTVSRRFITDYNVDSGKTSLIFGSGDGVNFDDELIPNLADLALPLAGRKTFSRFALDPQNFLKTRSMGLSPLNTTITVNYRVGGGQQTNVPRGSIKDVVNASFAFSSTNLNSQKKSSVERSIECINLVKADGGGPPDDITEIKLNGGAFFAAQDRTVSREDFIVRVKTIPEKFGKPEKVFVKKNKTSPLSIDIHVLSKDANGNFSLASQTLKNNIKTYLSGHRMLTDGVNILDSDIINLKVNFGVVVSRKYNRSEILTKCLSVLGQYFSNDRREIGRPIVISDVSAELQSVLGVISVYELSLSNAASTVDGFNYSNTRFDADANIRNNILFCPDNAIFEIKFPRHDIIGTAK